MDTILLANYSLVAYFSRGKKDTFKRATHFFLGSELIYALCALAMFVLSRFEYTLPLWMLALVLAAIWAVSSYGATYWLGNQIETGEMDRQYSALGSKKALFAWMGMALFVGSFVLTCVVSFTIFEGYSLR